MVKPEMQSIKERRGKLEIIAFTSRFFFMSVNVTKIKRSSESQITLAYFKQGFFFKLK